MDEKVVLADKIMKDLEERALFRIFASDVKASIRQGLLEAFQDPESLRGMQVLVNEELKHSEYKTMLIVRVAQRIMM